MTTGEQLTEFAIAVVLALSPDRTAHFYNPLNDTFYAASCKQQSDVTWGMEQTVIDVRCRNESHRWGFGYIHRRSIFKPLKPVDSWSYEEDRQPYED